MRFNLPWADVAEILPGYNGQEIRIRDEVKFVWAVQKSNLARCLKRRTRADHVADVLQEMAAGHGRGHTTAQSPPHVHDACDVESTPAPCSYGRRRPASLPHRITASCYRGRRSISARRRLQAESDRQRTSEKEVLRGVSHTGRGPVGFAPERGCATVSLGESSSRLRPSWSPSATRTGFSTPLRAASFGGTRRQLASS